MAGFFFLGKTPLESSIHIRLEENEDGIWSILLTHAECDEKDRRKGECWDGRGREDVRYPEREGDRYSDRAYARMLPEMVWGEAFDNDGRIVQRWLDENRNGRADRVSVYQNHRIVRVNPAVVGIGAVLTLQLQ